jgi:hypothetical protein
LGGGRNKKRPREGKDDLKRIYCQVNAEVNGIT